MGQRAILSVDLQNFYLPSGQLPLTGIDDAVANAARVIGAARDRKEPVIHVRHELLPDTPLYVPNNPADEIIDGAAPLAGEEVVVKHYANSFRDTRLKQVLDAQNIDKLVVVGAMSHMCVEAITRAAADLGYAVTVVHDACATMDLEFEGTVVPAAHVHAASMAALAFGYASVTSTANWLSAAPAPEVA